MASKHNDLYKESGIVLTEVVLSNNEGEAAKGYVVSSIFTPEKQNFGSLSEAYAFFREKVLEFNSSWNGCAILD